jgi:LmbE family N-acetylglucosaminyl deacetylase
MIEHFKRVLVLAPHTDDGELGCGGTIARLREAGVQVVYAAFSTARQSLPEGLPDDTLKHEVVEATARLGIPREDLRIFDYEVRKLNYSRQAVLEDMVRIRAGFKPDLVLMPSRHDIHQDHTTVAEEGLRAFKGVTLWGYELLWNNLEFTTNCFVRLEERHLERKAAALAEYRSQAGRPYMSSDFILSLARVRGVQIGCGLAECFEVVRTVL